MQSTNIVQICPLCPDSLRILSLANFSIKWIKTIFHSAYLPKHSIVETALLCVLMTSWLLQSGFISILALRADFDTVDHNILPTRLKNIFSICGLALFFTCEI